MSFFILDDVILFRGKNLYCMDHNFKKRLAFEESHPNFQEYVDLTPISSVEARNKLILKQRERHRDIAYHRCAGCIADRPGRRWIIYLRDGMVSVPQSTPISVIHRIHSGMLENLDVELEERLEPSLGMRARISACFRVKGLNLKWDIGSGELDVVRGGVCVRMPLNYLEYVYYRQDLEKMLKDFESCGVDVQSYGCMRIERIEGDKDEEDL